MNRFTLWGVYQYDPTLFDDVQVPDNVDKDILISCIMQTSGDLKPYYQQPAWLKHNITDWFRRMYFSIDKMMAAIKSEFNPVENYDRYEERNTSESEYSHDSASEMAYNSMSTSLSESQWNSMAQSQEHSMSEYLSESASESAMGSELAETEVSAFNSSTYENSQKVTTDRNSKSKNGHNSSHNSADIDASQQTDASKRGELSYESGGSQRQNYADTDRFHKYGEMAHIHGNIGIMEATTMIEHAVSMYRDIDVYKLIAYMFEKEFLIQLY